MSKHFKQFHIAFYTNGSKTVLSGVTYETETILDAIELFVLDKKTPSMNSIKYVSNEQLMTPKEKIISIKNDK